MKFSPDNLKARTGDTVPWISKDIFSHNIKETDKDLFFAYTHHPEDAFSWDRNNKRSKYLQFSSNQGRQHNDFLN